MIFIEPTKGQTEPSWADIDWHAVETNVKRLQERIYRATTNEDWARVKNLQKLLVRATSNKLLAIRRITQENQGRHTAGVDGVLCDTPEARLELFREGLKLQGYEPLPVSRVYIFKENGKSRPLGIPTVKDRVMQAVVKAALEPEWEARFEANSYGFRPGRRTMDAITALHTTACQKDSSQWIIDADISGCFDNIDQERLLAKLPVFTTTIRRWLKAGVVELGHYSPTDTGTPQGGVVSPLLANIVLHYVLDEWFEEEVRPRLKGEAFLIRYADDFIIGVSREDDARRIMDVLPKRMSKYGLTVHPEKTRLVRFIPPGEGDSKTTEPGNRAPETFDFLGFTHYWGRSQRGRWVVKRKTARSRLKRAFQALSTWCRENLHRPIAEQHQKLTQKLQGHYGYYGIIGNFASLQNFLGGARKIWKRWLSRRNRDGPLSWPDFERLEERYGLPKARVVHGLLSRVAKS